jgi:hypothetical protein
MTLEIQAASVLRRPAFGLAGAGIAALFSAVFLYFDGFYFVSPYLVAYVDPARLPLLLLDLAVSALSGVVITLSVYEIRSFPGRSGAYRRTGFAGIAAALLAGACPCYYLVPLLAVAGGAGGVLATVGLYFFDYQIPIKLGSVGLLLFTGLVQERALRAACRLPAQGESLTIQTKP